MSGKHYTREQIVSLLLEADVLLSKGSTVARRTPTQAARSEPQSVSRVVNGPVERPATSTFTAGAGTR